MTEEEWKFPDHGLVPWASDRNFYAESLDAVRRTILVLVAVTQARDIDSSVGSPVASVEFANVIQNSPRLVRILSA